MPLNPLKNLSIKIKIMSGYILALALLGLVGGVAVYRFYQTEGIVTHLADTLAREERLAAQISLQIGQMRFYTLKYINEQQPELLEQLNQTQAELTTLVTEAEKYSSQSDRKVLLDRIKADFQSYQDTFSLITEAIAQRQEIVTQTLDIQGPLAEQKLQELKLSAVDTGNNLVIRRAGDTQRVLLLVRLDVNKYLISGDKQWADKFDRHYQDLTTALKTLEYSLTERTEHQLMVEIRAAVDAYAAGFKRTQEVYTHQNQLYNDRLNVLGSQIARSSQAIVEAVETEFETVQAATTASLNQTRWLLFVTIGFTIVVCLGLAWGISALITRPLNLVTIAAGKLAKGDLHQIIAVKSQDELGVMMSAFQQMVTYLQEMAEAANRLAQGDLTAEIRPQSDQDVLGQAFARMIVNLRQLVRQVTDNARQVDTAASQLSAVANQAGQATAQITATIQQVAQGVSQQTQSVTQTAATVEQMARAIDGVAQGGQEQAFAINKFTRISTQTNTALLQVSMNARNGTQSATQAVQTANRGATTIEETMKGMEAIKTKVGWSAQKVREMGQRSDQIGAIVETIDDIASQTNLLALNAAIEAARAGEHGKGFAVVADEVRKLAEKSAGATKEITNLIKGIQMTVTEAVQAMADGMAEVDTGVSRADQARQALQTILQGVEMVVQQVQEISAAVQQIETSSQEVGHALDTVSAVVEENTAASEQMAASSSEVTRLIEIVAGVSEENSAAVEEVSASAEEMNAQVEEVSASAQSLAEMAQQLQQLVAQFKLAKNEASRTPANTSPEITPIPLSVCLREDKGQGFEGFTATTYNGRH